MGSHGRLFRKGMISSKLCYKKDYSVGMGEIERQ